jgi:hypothetical protein
MSSSEKPQKFTFLDLTVQNGGSSKRLTLPAEVSDDAECESGQQVTAEYDREAGTITYFLN